ncbi:tRNA (adenosine(37)-N6)-threonylcarbamoyltransferase complex dimerization subunit type 1 TsaB [Mariprofundus ferrooxydans]|uniref:Gcp-like domain-containing protein n=1 Tax=Mariprofundus ferrooxydans PV-1 TaxID=314345 RepID=Q0F0W9_9PROT|nr:tRNA (adenosine(37)-N6)-threonylcarbamoyltransferase complex dimerization subunit type 1 TsaB [Mariprofundus ferrooxydans]EAU55422.1 hypothetical protein SPV1_11836 [Mariprofundus ferrooxydans PV-1]KON47664.1 hypothetical protein AL013_06750 [Mariprofundus ferrooxydans]
MKQSMNILALDTATDITCACLHVNGHDYPAALDGGQRIRSTGIMPLLTGLLEQAGLEWKQLQLLAFSQGPGSFTGLRIGAATLAGINAGLHLPVLHLSSLAVTARQAAVTDQLWVVEDARAGEAFVGCYQDDAAVMPERCMQWQDIVSQLPPGRFVCHAEPPVAMPGWQRQPLLLDRATALGQQVQAVLPAQDKQCALPVYPAPAYMQLSQAERSAHAR